MKKRIYPLIVLFLAFGIMVYAADQKITDLTNDASPTSDDLVTTVNAPGTSPANRKVTLQNLGKAILGGQTDADFVWDTTTKTLTVNTGGLNLANGAVYKINGSALAASDVGAAPSSLKGTLTNTKWCTTDGTAINCTQNTPSGSGDVVAGSTAQTWGDGTGPIVWTFSVTGTDPTLTYTAQSIKSNSPITILSGTGTPLEGATVTNPFTTIESDVNLYFTNRYVSATNGGYLERGFSNSDSTPFTIQGYLGSADPTDTIPAVKIQGYKLNGTTGQALGAAETVFEVQNAATPILSVLGNSTVVATTFSGALTGNASTASALAADPANCAAGQIALGITAAGVAECTATPSGLTSVGATTFTGALTGNATTATNALPPAVQSVTCTDSGNGSPGALTITPTANISRVDISLTVNDADGCTITMAETSAVEETMVIITNISAANTATFTTAAGVLTLKYGSPLVLGAKQSLVLLYKGSEWLEIGRTGGISGITFGGFTASKATCSDGSGNLVSCTNLTDVTPLVAGGALGTPASGTMTSVTGLPAISSSAYSATTSAQLAGVISDETGSGVLVFGTSPTFTTSASLGTGYLSTTKTAGATGTTANYLCTIETATGKVNTAAVSATGILGIAVTTRAGGSDLTTEVVTRGIGSCVMDTGSTSVVGNIAIVGSTVAGTCKDSGVTDSTAVDKGAQILGKFLTVAAPTNAASIQFYGPGHYGTQVTETIGATFDGGGSAIAINKIVYRRVPWAATITEWMVICDTAEATMVVDVLRLTRTAGTLPTASMVGAGNHPTPTNYETWAAPSSWTSVAIVANDVLAFKVTTGAATATTCTVDLKVTR